eukprot:maker-scaffold5_size1054832-snap-gene-9.19 protein:Tk04061 transcript:maker-scaffold5_size1054832-snap-gene-9.19-mRNA-1 annotation:"growth arrest-specific protein 1 precursor"
MDLIAHGEDQMWVDELQITDNANVRDFLHLAVTGPPFLAISPMNSPTDGAEEPRAEVQIVVLPGLNSPLLAPSKELVKDPDNGCNFVSLKCSYRTGCGTALKSYLIECDGLIRNLTQECSEGCKNTLIGLTSTLEGERLMTCDCPDETCERTKINLQTCRPSVTYATRSDTVVSCSEARWICLSDAVCGNALEYYHRLCRGLFKGNRCSDRCKNSLAILRRQEKAVKLEHCVCRDDEMMEEFQCKDIQSNTRTLCYDPPDEEEEEATTLEPDNMFENEVDVDELPPIKSRAYCIAPLGAMIFGIPTSVLRNMEGRTTATLRFLASAHGRVFGRNHPKQVTRLQPGRAQSTLASGSNFDPN